MFNLFAVFFCFFFSGRKKGSFFFWFREGERSRTAQQERASERVSEKTAATMERPRSESVSLAFNLCAINFHLFLLLLLLLPALWLLLFRVWPYLPPRCSKYTSHNKIQTRHFGEFAKKEGTKEETREGKKNGCFKSYYYSATLRTFLLAVRVQRVQGMNISFYRLAKNLRSSGSSR